MVISASAHKEDKQKPENNLCVPTMCFREALILKGLSRLAIHVNNSQYLFHFCRRFLALQAAFRRLTCIQKRFGTCTGEGAKQCGFPAGTLDEASLIWGSREETALAGTNCAEPLSFLGHLTLALLCPNPGGLQQKILPKYSLTDRFKISSEGSMGSWL